MNKPLYLIYTNGIDKYATIVERTDHHVYCWEKIEELDTSSVANFIRSIDQLIDFEYVNNLEHYLIGNFLEIEK